MSDHSLDAARDGAHGQGVGTANASTSQLLGLVEGDAVGAAPDLAGLLAAWPTLPEHLRAAILALVRVASGAQDGAH